MGRVRTIQDADFGTIMQKETVKYLTNSQITDPLISDKLNRKIISWKNDKIWDVTSHLYLALGTTVNQVKLNVKTGADALTNAGGGPIQNVINKGFELEGLGNLPGPSIDIPLTETFMEAFATGDGHVLYFSNETLNPTGSIVAGLGNVISTNLFALTSSTLFTFSGASGTAPQKKTLISRNRAAIVAGSFTSAGVFGAVKIGTTVYFVGNGVLLGSATMSGTAGTTSGNMRLQDGKYPVNNTIPVMSFGLGLMTVDQMITYQLGIMELIEDVHGIVIP